MAEVNGESKVKPSHQPPRFVEVVCKSSGKIRRFSSGTEAGFAVNLMNRKVLSEGIVAGNGNVVMASYIEAVKEGEEEPVSFGPNSMLVDYGPGWKLQTVVESYGEKGQNVGPKRVRKVVNEDFDDPNATGSIFQTPISCIYISKILFAFALLFVFGAFFTLVLENLPRVILYISSLM